MFFRVRNILENHHYVKVFGILPYRRYTSVEKLPRIYHAPKECMVERIKKQMQVRIIFILVDFLNWEMRV